MTGRNVGSSLNLLYQTVLSLLTYWRRSFLFIVIPCSSGKALTRVGNACKFATPLHSKVISASPIYLITCDLVTGRDVGSSLNLLYKMSFAAGIAISSVEFIATYIAICINLNIIT